MQIRQLLLLLLAATVTTQFCIPKPVFVSSKESLQAALDSAIPGMTITMATREYWGKFTINQKMGRATCPIVLNGMNSIIVGTEDEEESTCFTAKGIKFWIMTNLGFRLCGTGFKMEQSSMYNKMFNLAFSEISKVGFEMNTGTENILSGFTFKNIGSWYNPWAVGAKFSKDQMSMCTGWKFGPRILGYGVEINKSSQQGKFTGAVFNGVDKMVLAGGSSWQITGNVGKTTEGEGIVGGFQIGASASGAVASGNTIKFTDSAKQDNGSGGGAGTGVGASGNSLSPDADKNGNLLCRSNKVENGNDDPQAIYLPC